MMQVNNDFATPKDRDILRSLAASILDEANTKQNIDLKNKWKQHNSLKGTYPLLLIETCGVIDEVIPLDSLECECTWARGIERSLRDRLFYINSIKDDHTIEPRIALPYSVQSTDFGMSAVFEKGDNEGHLGSYRWDPPIKNLSADINKLKFREYTVDYQATDTEQARLESIFADMMPVIRRSSFWWTQGMTWYAVQLLGLEQFMLAMYDQPHELHTLMAFLRDEHINTIEWFENNGLLNLNNEDDYIGSGSVGYTDELPQKDYTAGQPVRLKDTWVLSESQETVGISATMFDEFVFRYQKPIIERFELSYYGCCEPVHNRWNVINQLANLRKVSVSPWCNEELMVEYLGKDYVYCRKPNPALISTEKWNEDLIRSDLRKTLEVTRGMNVEIVMKDVHTICGQPWRLGRWVELAREEILKVMG